MPVQNDHEEAECLAELAELKKSIRQGVRSVTYKDQTVTYRSLSEMRSIQRELETHLGLRRGPRTWGAYATKGATR